DQRGFTRPAGARSDIGAVEISLSAPFMAQQFAPGAAALKSVVSLELTISNLNNIPLTGLRLTNILSPSLSISAGSVTTIGFNGTVAAIPGTRTILLSGFS